MPWCPRRAHRKFILENMYVSWLEFLEARDLETPFKHSAEALKKPQRLHQEAKGQRPEPGTNPVLNWVDV